MPTVARSSEIFAMADTVFSSTDDKVIEIDVPPNPDSIGNYFISCHINDANGVVIWGRK